MCELGLSNKELELEPLELLDVLNKFLSTFMELLPENKQIYMSKLFPKLHFLVKINNEELKLIARKTNTNELSIKEKKKKWYIHKIQRCHLWQNAPSYNTVNVN